MEQQVTGTIVSVTPTTVNTKRGPAVKNTIMLASGAELQTFKADLAQTAASLIGQAAEITYEINQNGDFTNYYPTKILPVANPALQAQMAQAALQGGLGAQFAGQVAQAAPQPQAAPLASYDYFADPKTISIHRQKATDVATKLMSADTTPAQFWANVEALVVYYNTGATPTDLAALDPDGDIPF